MKNTFLKSFSSLKNKNTFLKRFHFYKMKKHDSEAFLLLKNEMARHVSEAFSSLKNKKHHVFEVFLNFSTKWKNTFLKRFHIYKIKNTFFKSFFFMFKKTKARLEAFSSLQNEKEHVFEAIFKFIAWKPPFWTVFHF